MKHITVILLLFATLSLSSQQLEKWSSYYENGFVWNPALTAKWNTIETSITHQQSWIGFLDAPIYSTVTFQYPFVSGSTSRMSMGAIVESDIIGPLSRINASMTYAYGFSPQLFDTYDDILTFGILGNFSRFTFDPAEVVVFDERSQELDDYTIDSENLFSPNMGVGVFYNSVSDFYAFQKSHYYIGLSARNIINTRISALRLVEQKSQRILSNTPHVYLHLGYRWIPFSAGYNSKNTPFWEPNIMMSYGATNSFNVMANLRYEVINKYWISTGGATSGEVYTQAGVIFDKKSFMKPLVRDGVLRIGAKIDYHVGNFGKHAGIGYEFYLAYLFENDTSFHYRP